KAGKPRPTLNRRSAPRKCRSGWHSVRALVAAAERNWKSGSVVKAESSKSNSEHHWDLRSRWPKFAAGFGQGQRCGIQNPSERILPSQRFDALSNIAIVNVAAVCLHEVFECGIGRARLFVSAAEFVMNGDQRIGIEI